MLAAAAVVLAGLAMKEAQAEEEMAGGETAATDNLAEAILVVVEEEPTFGRMVEAMEALESSL